MAAKYDSIRIKAAVRKALWLYKVRYDCRSLSEAIRHALKRLKEFEA